MIRNSVKTYALCSSALVALAYGVEAHAQAGDGAAAAEEVVVTGSRIVTNGFAQPTPVTVLTMEQMQATAPDSLTDAVLQLPQFRSSFQPSSTAFNPGSTSNAGASFINLRGLGPRRGLTLLNGERVVSNSAQAGSSVDISTLPQQLMRRVDVVTGGASAAYGSDALSGVTNFILDTRYTGTKGEVRGGISRYGDNASVGASIAHGRAILGGRGHIIASYEYYRTTGIKGYGYGGRDWATSRIGVYGNTAAGCATPQTSTTCPTRIITGPMMPAGFSSGGIIAASSLTGPAAAALGVNTHTFVGGGTGTNAGVTTIPFPFGTLRTNSTAATGTMIGGGIDPPLGNYMNYIPVNLRHSAYLRAEYDLTDDWTVHADLLYGWSANKYRGQIPVYSGVSGVTSRFTIFEDNPFLPASIASQLQNAPRGPSAPALYNPATGQFNGPRLNTISVARAMLDWPIQQNYANFSTLRFSGGINGNFNAFGTDWDLTGYYTHGRGMRTSSTVNVAIVTNLFNAVDAVRSPGGPGLPAAGTPMCRSTLTNRNDACVPLNVIGQEQASAAALNYVYGGPTAGNTHTSQVLKQDVVDFAVRGEPFSTWAGPVAVGGGATYRRDSVVSTADTISDLYNPALPGTNVFKPGLTAPLTINGFPGGTVVGGVTGGAGAPRGNKGGWTHVNNGSGLPGSLNVKEVFVETLIPLARDLPFAQQFDVNLAFRYADYQYGGGVKNWKIGATYRPIEDIRFRTTLSRDVRAPNLGDLFAGQSITLAGVSDPFRRNSLGQNETGGGGNSISSGNLNLKPETGRTFTIGAVVTPRWIPGLTMSADYYHIILTDAINQLSGNVVVNQCFDGNSQFCTFVTRSTDPASFGGFTIGPITSVFLPVMNAGAFKMAGVDIEASYVLPLSRIWEGRTDTLTMRAVFNYQGKNATYVIGSSAVTNAVGTIAGGIIQGTGGNYDWGGNFNVNYRNGPLTFNWQQRFINESRIQTNVDENGVPFPANATVNPNTTLNGMVPNLVPAYWYSDVSVSYRFGPDRRYEGFLTVQNLFDKDPPMLGSLFVQGVIPTNNAVYNGVGRSYTAGIRFRF